VDGNLNTREHPGTERIRYVSPGREGKKSSIGVGVLHHDRVLLTKIGAGGERRSTSLAGSREKERGNFR